MPGYLGKKKNGAWYLGDVKIGQGYLGDTLVYQSAFNVTYVVDTGVEYTEKVKPKASMLSPTTFTPEKSGWTFAGWRSDTTASGAVLTDAKATGHTTLYAVFTQTVTVSYAGNGATSGSTNSQVGTRYYNNGNIENPSFTLRSSGFSKSYYNFTKWAMGSASGTQYAAGASVTLTANATFYALWVSAYTASTAKMTTGIHQPEYNDGVVLFPSYGQAVSISGTVLSWYNTSRQIKANAPCTVTVKGGMTFQNVDAYSGYRCNIFLYKNGSQVSTIYEATDKTSYSWGYGSGSAKTITLNAGDILDIRVQGGSSKNGASRTRFEVHSSYPIVFTGTPT